MSDQAERARFLLACFGTLKTWMRPLNYYRKRNTGTGLMKDTVGSLQSSTMFMKREFANAFG
jgi:uncharacterized protein YqgQ